MKKLSFMSQNANSILHLIDGDSNRNLYNFPMDKMTTCPHCLTGTGGVFICQNLYDLDNGIKFLTQISRCTECGRLFAVNYVINLEEKCGRFISVYPEISERYDSELIQNLSPRFIDLYNQALTAEFQGSIDLAAVGFRSAVEVLIKDYAITELNEEESTVARLSLSKAIEKYLDYTESRAADVVRIFGNDYTHYKEKYPDKDFAVIKRYMEILINEIEAKLLISHPPVSREQN